MQTLLCLAALFALVAPALSLESFVVGGFGQNYISQIAQAKGYFEDHDLDVTFLNVQGSEQQFHSLDDGTYDLISTAADNVIYRRLNLGHDQYVVVGENSGSPAMWLIATTGLGIEDLEDMEGKTILADSTLSGFVLPLRKIFLDAGIPLPDNLLLPSGGLFARLNTLIANQTNATMALGPLAILTLARHPHLVKVGDLKPLLCPYSGTQYVVLQSWVANPANKVKLESYLKAELKAWAYMVDPANKAEMIDYIMTRESTDSTTANEIFDLTIADPDVGINPYFIPRRTGMINSIELRTNELKVSRETCLPLSAELVSKHNGWIDLSYLQNALISLQSLFNFYNLYGVYYGTHTCAA